MRKCLFQPWFTKFFMSQSRERLKITIHLPIVSAKHIQGIIPCNKSMLATSGNKKDGAKNASFQMTTYFFSIYNDLWSIVLIWGKVAIIFSSDCTLPWGQGFDLLTNMISTNTSKNRWLSKLLIEKSYTVYHRPGNLVYVKSISSFGHHNVLIKVPSTPREYPGHSPSWHTE